MQANTEQLMTKQDFITLAEQLNRIEQQNAAIQQMLIKQPSKKLVLTNAKEVGVCLGVSEWQARDLMRHPNFPKSLTKRTGTYNRGKWKASEVERFFMINKNKV